VHLGNVLHFLIVERWATDLDLVIHVRIDDFDTGRVQSRYVEDIFRVLQELNITWHSGPQCIAEVAPSLNPAYAWQELTAAKERGLVTFQCSCSRRSRSAEHSCQCREQRLPFVPGSTSVRLDAISMGLDPAFDGVVLWRRDDVPAYHLASVVLDRDAGITHIIRGEDLRPATEIQVVIAPYFDATNVQQAVIRHHALLHDDRGVKLSKSAGARATPLALPDRHELDHGVSRLLASDG